MHIQSWFVLFCLFAQKDEEKASKQSESSRRENVLMMRLTSKEHELQECMVSLMFNCYVTELNGSLERGIAIRIMVML